MSQENISAQTLGAHRAGLVCCCIFRLEWSNAFCIALIAGTRRLRYADELVTRGFLIRLETGLRYGDRYIYILSALGRELAQFELDNFGDLIPTRSPYTVTEHQRVAVTHNIHNMAALEILLKLAGNMLDWLTLWRSEPEEQHSQDESSAADLVENFLKTPDRESKYDYTRLHEIENNQKTGARLLYWLRLRIERLLELGEGRGCCIIWCTSNAIFESYQDALESPLPGFHPSNSGKPTLDQSKPFVRAEPWMFLFFKLERDERGSLHPRDEDIATLKAQVPNAPA